MSLGSGCMPVKQALVKQCLESFRLFSGNNGTLSFLLDSEGIIRAANCDPYAFLGMTAEQIVDKMHWSELIQDDVLRSEMLTRRQERIDKATSGESSDSPYVNYQCRIVSPQNQTYHFELHISELEKFHMTYVSVLDITDRIQALSALKISEERASFAEAHDNLTGLPNLRMFTTQIAKEIQVAQRRERIFAVMCVGIDRFKDINDVYGLKVGDSVLLQVSDRLTNAFRIEDSVSRLRGDKFMILLSDLGDADHISDIVAKTRKIFSEPFFATDKRLDLTASIGISIYPSDGGTPAALIKNAETAMYLAKESGKNSYQLYNHSQHDRMKQKIQLEKEMVQALANDEFLAYYQPKVDGTGALVGMEALIRWKNPQRGMVQPFEFIPLAEKNGFIVELGYYMLERSCQQAKIWQDQGYPPLQVAVNLSPYQFRQKDLIARIKKIIRTTGLAPRWLEIEITESGIMDDETEAIEKLKQLYDMGISVSIDDFGTGYSSLNKLKDFPLDKLKIDKSFLDNMLVNKRSSTITTSIIGMAHDLGFKVVAEGVESADQLSFLKKYNCDHFQGFYFDRPLSPEDFERRLRIC